MTYPPHLIDRVRSSVRIEHVVAEHTALRRQGKELVGTCCFHSPDRNPSMCVNPAKQVFICRSCQAGGDVFGFLKLFGMPFTEAMRYLADFGGVSLTPDTRAKAEKIRQQREDCAAWWAYVGQRYEDRRAAVLHEAQVPCQLDEAWRRHQRAKRWTRICAKLRGTAPMDLYRRFTARQGRPETRAGVRVGRPIMDELAVAKRALAARELEMERERRELTERYSFEELMQWMAKIYEARHAAVDAFCAEWPWLEGR